MLVLFETPAGYSLFKVSFLQVLRFLAFSVSKSLICVV